MKWTYSIQQKLTAAALLAAVFVGIFIVNRLENHKVQELGESMDTVYKDRLMAENYLFRLSGLLYEKKIMLDECTAQEDISAIPEYLAIQNRAINRLVSDYEQTKLTPLEEKLFDELKVSIDGIHQQESQFMATIHTDHPEESRALYESFQSANHLLNDLSNLQINVGKSVNERSQQLVAGTNLLTHFELAMLIVIGLLVHALIFASRSIRGKFNQPHNLN